MEAKSRLSRFQCFAREVRPLLGLALSLQCITGYRNMTMALGPVDWGLAVGGFSAADFFAVMATDLPRGYIVSDKE